MKRKEIRILLFILIVLTLTFTISDVYAKSKYKYTITYILDKGTNCSGNPEGFKKNNKKITLCDPKRKGYTFKGWYSNKSKTKQVTEIKKKANKNIKLYAKWSKNKYYVKYDGNGGNGEMSKSTFKYDTKYNLKSNSYSKKGYNFVGWNTKKDGTGKSYTDGQRIKSLTNKNKKTITLYAMWQINKYYVQYDANGGTGSMKKSTFKYNKKYTLKVNQFVRDNYIFVGWNTKKDGTGTSYTNGQEIKNMTSKNEKTIKLYAMWSKVTTGKKNALEKAKDYLDVKAFSKEGLKQQLTSRYGEGFTEEEAEYAVNNVGANWNEQALKAAEEYLDVKAFSKEGLKHQLTSEYGEQFTEEEAEYAVNNVKVSWKKQALKAAEEYLDVKAFSKKGLKHQLTSKYGEQFTEAEAEYAVNNVKVNWKEQALKAAEEYLEVMSFSKERLKQQLTSEYGEQFTEEEAEYAVNKIFG